MNFVKTALVRIGKKRLDVNLEILLGAKFVKLNGLADGKFVK